MSRITTQVLDTSRGQPAEGVPVMLEYLAKTGWEEMGGGLTNSDGRVPEILAEGDLVSGDWRFTFDTTAYFEATGVPVFYPYVQVMFTVSDPTRTHAIPLLLSPFGYSTHRGT